MGWHDAVRASRGLALGSGLFLCHETTKRLATATIDLPDTLLPWQEAAILNVGYSTVLLALFGGLAVACNLDTHLSYARPPRRVLYSVLGVAALLSSGVVAGIAALGLTADVVVSRAGILVAPGMFLAAGATAIFTALHEETIYRGLIQSILTDHTTPRVGVVLASLLFMLAHLSVLDPHSLGGQLYLAGALGFGLLLGGLYEWSGTLILPIGVHTVYNMVFFGYLYVIL